MKDLCRFAVGQPGQSFDSECRSLPLPAQSLQLSLRLPHSSVTRNRFGFFPIHTGATCAPTTSCQSWGLGTPSGALAFLLLAAYRPQLLR